MKSLLISLILPLTLFTTACGDKVETYDLMSNDPPPPVVIPPLGLSRFTETGELNKDSFDPKLEVLFVIDNSTSMEDEINKLSQNINKFVDGFTKNTRFEYNVAVMSVYDHRRFQSQKFKDKFGGTEYEFDVGEFRAVKDRYGKVIPDKYYINSGDEDVSGMLKQTLSIGIQSLRGAGPEVEESFSPISAAYGFGPLAQEAQTKEQQSGFFFKDANSYKVIFIVTDASDNSTLSAGDLHRGLVKKSNGDASKVMGFGAISTGNCNRDPGVKNSKIENFLRKSRPDLSSNNIVSLCSDFGSQFARFGQAIKRKILSQSIRLTHRPDFSDPNAGDANECMKPKELRNQKAIIVCYGDQRIYLRTRVNGPAGYRYNPANNSIQLDDRLEYQAQKDARLGIEYTLIHPEAQVEAWGQ